MKLITGTFPEAAGGTLRLVLNQYALIGFTGRNAPRTYLITLEADGSIPPQTKIWGNDELTPEGTAYQVTVLDNTGTIVRGPLLVAICGTSPIDVSLLVPGPPPAPPPVTVTVSPLTPIVTEGMTQQFTATVTNTSDTAVTWTADQGSIDSTGLFTAPVVTAETMVTVTATSVSDTTQSASASVSVMPIGAVITIDLTPLTSTVTSGGTEQFTATVTGTSNTAVAWTTDQGTIDANGLFTAPQVTADTTATVTAALVGDPTRTASTSILVTPVAAIIVSIAPLDPTVTAGATEQFTATVENATDTSVDWTTDQGTIDTNGLYTAPQVTTQTTAQVTATSVEDPTQSASTTVTVMPTLTTQIDLLNWMGLANPDSQHLTGDPTSGYLSFMIDTDPNYPAGYPAGTFWYIKNPQGNPWDACTYDANYSLMHWITEDGDSEDQPLCPNSDCWNYANAYKRFLTPVPILPRHLDPTAGPVTINSPGPNTVNRTVDCENSLTGVITIGDIMTITYPPVLMDWGGDVGNAVLTIKNEYYLSGTIAAQDWQDREDTFYVQGFGRIAWIEYKMISGAWQQTNSNINTQLAAGGAPQPNFPCGPGKPWF